jgi:fimbrial chaperone protein
MAAIRRAVRPGAAGVLRKRLACPALSALGGVPLFSLLLSLLLALLRAPLRALLSVLFRASLPASSRRLLLSVALNALSALAAPAAHAATLQISPVMVDLPADANATGITLRNPGDKPLFGQVRVFRWDQANGDDTLTPTQDLVASPPLIQIAGHADQLVRLVRTTPAPASAEQGYRVLIDELPEPDAATTSGVTIRLRYSVPVFVEPPTDVGQPKLTWHLQRADQSWLLRIDNTGRKRAQIAGVQLVDSAGNTYPINKGLLGYALAGRDHHWPVALPANANLSGPLKVRAAVNSLPAEAAVSVD